MNAATLIPYLTVLVFSGGSRRFLVTAVTGNNSDRVDLVALSGGYKGCRPTCVPAAGLKLASNQAITFTGKSAAYLQSRVDTARDQGIAIAKGREAADLDAWEARARIAA